MNSSELRSRHAGERSRARRAGPGRRVIALTPRPSAGGAESQGALLHARVFVGGGVRARGSSRPRRSYSSGSARRARPRRWRHSWPKDRSRCSRCCRAAASIPTRSSSSMPHNSAGESSCSAGKPKPKSVASRSFATLASSRRARVPLLWPLPLTATCSRRHGLRARPPGARPLAAARPSRTRPLPGASLVPPRGRLAPARLRQ
jgi:hypothetical protein